MIFLFVHIAKAAGSSVNRFFQQQLGDEACLVHQESNPVWKKPDIPPDMLDGVRFVSGHVPYHVFTQWLEKHDLHTITVLRNPYSHVVSHLAWIRHLMDPGQEVRLAAHPGFIQGLARKLASIDLEEPEEISILISNLNEHEWRLLDNPQVRYLTSRSHGGSGMQERNVTLALETLSKIDTFGFIEDPQNLFDLLAEAVGVNARVVDVPHENSLSHRYGLSSENEPQMQALMPLIQHDIDLYQKAKVLYENRADERVTTTFVPHRLRGNVGLPNADGMLPGWAFDADSNAIIQVDVYINKYFFSTISADIPREDLKEKFGCDCAFSLDLKKADVKPGDEVSVFFHDTNVEINGSPRKFLEGSVT